MNVIQLKRYRVLNLVSLCVCLLATPLAVAAFDPGNPVNLSRIASNNNVSTDFKISPDGKVVVYRARTTQSGDRDLFSVPVSGGEPTNLTADIAGDVSSSFKISNDSRKIVYRLTNPQGELSLRLATVPTNAGFFISKVLSGRTINTPTSIRQFLISSDSSHVVYAATKRLVPAFRLYSMSLVEPIPDEPTMVAGRGAGLTQRVYDFEFVPSQNRIVYTGDLDEADKEELYTSPSNTFRAAVKLNVTLASGRKVSDFDVSPDGNYVVYIADARVEGLRELYSTSLLVPEFNKLNPNTIASTEDIFNFRISPNSRYVVYRSNERNVAIVELYSVPINDNGGTQSTRISTNLPQDGDVSGDYQISPNSTRVVYRAYLDDQRSELFSTFISSRNTVSLTPGIGADEVVENFGFNKSGANVVYQLANTETMPSVTNLYSVRVAGRANVALSPTDSGNLILRYVVHPELDRVFYIADQRHDGLFELFSSKVSGPSSSSRLINTPFSRTSGKAVSGFKISNDGKYLVYRADQDIPGKRELYSVNLDAGGICFPIKARNNNIATVCL